HFEQALHQLRDSPNVIDIRNCGLAGAIQLAPRNGDPAIRPFEAGLQLWKQGFYVRFGGDTLQFGPTFTSTPAQLDSLFDAVGGVLKQLAYAQRGRPALGRPKPRPVVATGNLNFLPKQPPQPAPNPTNAP